MSHPSQLTDRDLRCLVDALCCVCVADARISRAEFSVLLNALKIAGVHQSDRELRTLVEARCREIHKAGIRKSAEATIASVRTAGNPQLGDLICRLQASALSADGRVMDRESEVARLFRDAFHAETRCQDATPPGGQATEPEIRQPQGGIGVSRVTLWMMGLLAVTLLFFGTLIGLGVRDTKRHAAEKKPSRRQVHEIEQAKHGAVHSEADSVRRTREDTLKKLAHVAAQNVNNLYRKQGLILGKTYDDSYNELYLEIHTRLDAETAGLTGDESLDKMGDICKEWVFFKMSTFLEHLR